jgi:Lon protease-like protein
MFAGLLARFAGPLIVVALLLSAIGVQTFRLHTAETHLAEVKAAWATARAQAAEEASKAAESYRQIEQQLAATKEKAQDDYNAAQRKNAAALAAERAGNERLRNQLAAYAAGSGSATEDTVAACSSRAATLGSLLDKALRADADSAGDAEANGDSVRAILAAWPR